MTLRVMQNAKCRIKRASHFGFARLSAECFPAGGKGPLAVSCIDRQIANIHGYAVIGRAGDCSRRNKTVPEIPPLSLGAASQFGYAQDDASGLLDLLEHFDIKKTL